MPPLNGFTDNAFRTRADLVRGTEALLKPLGQYRSPCGARVKLQPSTYAAFDDVAAQLEGFARPLWVIAGLLSQDVNSCDFDASGWLSGIEAGVDPASTEYWGDLNDIDQRMVEMESIAFTLLTAPEATLSLLSKSSQEKLKTWLSQINNYNMPQNNWRWFRIFVNLALFQVLGVPENDVRPTMDADFAMLDSFYLSEGWSSDGLWGDDRKQADYYSGSFAIQFAQLLYVRLAVGDEARVQRYRDEARLFAAKFWRYFDSNGMFLTYVLYVDFTDTPPTGAAIPFGRSMTYRFAFAAFWAAVALSGVQLGAPLDNIGTVKGLLLRHLRWWSRHPDMFNTDGTLNIGFAYPNMYLSEEYNSPQSVYWCLKSFIVLGLPETHVFWTCDEKPYPLRSPAIASDGAGELPIVEVVWPPRQIICNSPEHHFFLSSGQMTKKGHKAKEAKYGKLAYSSAFGFSVPVGLLLTQMAPDSTLTVSIDDGETWKVRSDPFNVTLGHAVVDTGGGSVEKVPTLVSSWRPWKMFPIEVETTLMPLVERFPGWHVRVHRIRWLGEAQDRSLLGRLELVDSGFALPVLTTAGYHVPVVKHPGDIAAEGHSTTVESCLIRSKAGASGLLDLTAEFRKLLSAPVDNAAVAVDLESHGHLVRADPNTNLISQRTFIPSMKHVLLQKSSENSSSEAWLVSGVFAASASTEAAAILDIPRMWSNRPHISSIEHDDGVVGTVYKISG